MRPSREIAAELMSTPAGRPVAPGRGRAGDDLRGQRFRARVAHDAVGRPGERRAPCSARSSTRASASARTVSPTSARITTRAGRPRAREEIARSGAMDPADGRHAPLLGRRRRQAGHRGDRAAVDGRRRRSLEEGGDRLEAFTFSRKRVNRVVAEVTGTRTVQTDFIEKNASGERRRRGELNALRLRVHGSPLTRR